MVTEGRGRFSRGGRGAKSLGFAEKSWKETAGRTEKGGRSRREATQKKKAVQVLRSPLGIDVAKGSTSQGNSGGMDRLGGGGLLQREDSIYLGGDSLTRAF